MPTKQGKRNERVDVGSHVGSGWRFPLKVSSDGRVMWGTAEVGCGIRRPRKIERNDKRRIIRKPISSLE